MISKFVNIRGNICKKIEVFYLNKCNVANILLVKKYGKSKEYIKCNLYFKKNDDNTIKYLNKFKEKDYVHMFGYFKSINKKNKLYKNFIINNFDKLRIS